MKNTYRISRSRARAASTTQRVPLVDGVISSYETEGKIYAKYILQNINDRENRRSLSERRPRQGLLRKGSKTPSAIRRRAESSRRYLTSSPTLTKNPQIIELKASGANVFLNASSPKFAARRFAKPTSSTGTNAFPRSTGQSIPAALVPAGLEKALGIISSISAKDPNDPGWANDNDMQEYLAFMKRYFPDGDPSDVLAFGGYSLAQAMIYILEQCGDNLTRENVMYQATHMHDVEPLLAGHQAKYHPDKLPSLQSNAAVKFDGKRWAPFGDVIGE